ncbi:unnamed protein product [Arctogadus glacialis]
MVSILVISTIIYKPRAPGPLSSGAGRPLVRAPPAPRNRGVWVVGGYTYSLTPPNRVELHLQPDTTQQSGATPTA